MSTQDNKFSYDRKGFDAKDVKQGANGRWPDILAALASVPAELLDGEHHPCPKCGGTDRFRFTDANGDGGAVCRCGKFGDGFAVLQWLQPELTFPETLSLVAQHIGLVGTANGSAKVDIIDRVCRAKRVPREGLEALGAHSAKRGKLDVVRVPMFDAKGDECSHFDLVPDGKGWNAKDKPAGYFRPVNHLPQPGETWLLTEGAKDSGTLASMGFNVIGTSTSYLAAKFARVLRNCHVVVIPDLDKAGFEGAERTSRNLWKVATSVGIARLPGEVTDSGGKDVRDIIRQHGEDEVRAAIDDALAAPLEEPPKEQQTDDTKHDIKQAAKDSDQSIAAEIIMDGWSHDGMPRLRFWRESFFVWRHGCYRELSNSELRAQVVNKINLRYCGVGTSFVNSIIDHLRAKAIVPSRIDAPSWLEKANDGWKPTETIATKSKIINLPAFLSSGCTDGIIDATPRFFNTTALDFEFDHDAPKPCVWLGFLKSLWGDDAESIQTLQEWFGLCLVADTSYQKMLFLLGPPRSGKGTIARIISELVGKDNVGGPTLAGMATNFGLSGLLHKSVGIISDARLTSKSDQGIINERLLSITGEDRLTVDRKHKDPVSVRIGARLMILSNELPRLIDSSEALRNRFVLLQLTNSFLGKEDRLLDQKLSEELPAILLWAMKGWERLNERGHFIQPKSAADAIAELKDLSSPISGFIEECCNVDPDVEESLDRLFEAYKEWCDRNGRHYVADTATFARDLRAALPKLKRRRQRVNKKYEAERRQTSYVGIELC